MRYLLFILLLGFCITSTAQQNSRSVTRSINDDGKTLKLKYEAVRDGHTINYENEFAVNGWNQQQKDSLVNAVIDSLQNTKTQQRSYMNRQIHDDGETLAITVDGVKDGRRVSYKNSFNVKGKSQKEKDALVKEVMTSLNLIEEEKK
ncbi:MAG: hypothetical protein ICV84_17500 [Flavisolibacter sp.]|nr:hypothetical protein [Flavisolibacter sp.]MBD0296967.1 hypothetical protein [Flavisolibacter sp.]